MTSTGPSNPAPSRAEANELASAANDAGLAIFRAAAEDADNAVVSPLSIALAFGMIKVGASGPVSDALDSLFGYPATGMDMLARFRALATAMTRDEAATVQIANRAFLDQGFTANPEWANAIGTWLDAGIEALPLSSDPSGARRRINAWTSDRTEGMIPELLPVSMPGPDSQLLLVNTVYLRAEWERQFTRDDTWDEDFTLLDGSTIDSEMMHRTIDTSFVVDDHVSAIRLPYLGMLEMVILVPPAEDFTRVRGGWDQSMLDELDSRWSDGKVELTMPRFEAESRVDLRDTIETRLGVSGLFESPGLDGIGEDLGLSGAVHAVKMLVDEEGTEAAAATAIDIMFMGSVPEPSAPPVVIRVDRPFLYAIRHVGTGAIAFAGQVTAPVAPEERPGHTRV
ncbi:serpin family protein [Demequina zhanjiangensis]|uniref:Serpin family protein n=1 Tax=Demequina zhanjiangensis TaxID=3051659 RepID=A0ABT8FZ94_9MICO|nr:serpin family protein [Demequina sp. SYSU T00b26]MDN4472208.1 serpin family protein [Demequina sp. SYSU T00b26]